MMPAAYLHVRCTPDGAYVGMSAGSRIDCHWGEVEWRAMRTAIHNPKQKTYAIHNRADAPLVDVGEARPVGGEDGGALGVRLDKRAGGRVERRGAEKLKASEAAAQEPVVPRRPGPEDDAPELGLGPEVKLFDEPADAAPRLEGLETSGAITIINNNNQ